MVNVGCLLLVEVGSILVGDEQVGLLLLLLTLGSPVPLLTLHLTEKENLPSISNSNFEKQEANLVLKKTDSYEAFGLCTVFLNSFPTVVSIWLWSVDPHYFLRIRIRIQLFFSMRFQVYKTVV